MGTGNSPPFSERRSAIRSPSTWTASNGTFPSMHAWRGPAYGPPESLFWEEVQNPPLEEGQVGIDVKASAVNFPDILFAAGTYQVKPPPPFIPGLEIAGV